MMGRNAAAPARVAKYSAHLQEALEQRELAHGQQLVHITFDVGGHIVGRPVTRVQRLCAVQGRIAAAPGLSGKACRTRVDLPDWRGPVSVITGNPRAKRCTAARAWREMSYMVESVRAN